MTGGVFPCCDMATQASAFVDGELDDEAWQHLQAHLADCAPCAEYVRQIGLTVEVLRRLPGGCAEQTRAELVRRYRVWVVRQEAR